MNVLIYLVIGLVIGIVSEHKLNIYDGVELAIKILKRNDKAR